MSQDVFQPTSLAFLANPYSAYKVLRETAPIFFYKPWQKWVLTCYEDVNYLLRDKRLGRVLENSPPPSANPLEVSFEASRRGSLLEIEPPDHTRIKDVFHQTFTPKRVRQLGLKIESISQHLVDKLLSFPQRQADLIEDFAQTIPVTVIADLLGVPEEDRHLLVPWSKGIIGWFEPERSHEMEELAARCAQEFIAYLKQHIVYKRARPEDDLISAMILVHDTEPHRLSEEELINNCILLLNAGHEAVVNVVGNGMYALLKYRDQWEKLKSDASLIPTAVEEMMRFDTPLQFFERYTLEDIEYKGLIWKRGTGLCLYYASANHDPKVFKNPETFDITRDPNPHIAFGLGLHYCIGAPLARVELQTSLRTLIERLPDLHLLDQNPEYYPKNVFRYLKTLRVGY